MKTKLLLLTLLISGLSFAQQTYVPDDNFENYLETHDGNGNTIAIGNPNSMGNGVANDNYVTTANIDTVTNLVVGGQNIADLTGIEDFVALSNLYCSFNQLTSLDTSQNTNLIWLTCFGNQITSLDVSQNLSLEQLDCNGNQLTNLDVSQNANLTQLGCAENQLTSLDVSQNTNLYAFNCYHNQLTSLNVKNGNNTNIGYFNALYNPNLTCIEVDDVAYSNANWTNIGVTSSFSLDCSTYGLTYVPDDNFENYLETHDANGNNVALGDPNSMGNGMANDDYVITANINTVTSLNVIGRGIADLTGIEGFILLEDLFVGNNNLQTVNLANNSLLKRLEIYQNQLTSIDVSSLPLLQLFHIASNNLTSIDVSNNPNLALFRCQANNISTIDVSQNPLIYQLYVNENNLTSLDVSQNINLNQLYCFTNNLISLNVANGNNVNFTSFNATSNPNLTCIEVDDVAYSTANWPDIDPQSSFSTNCADPETYVPDDNFENYLETHDANGNNVALGDPNSMGNGMANDDYVTTANINTVTSLNVNNQSIADMTGVEDFIALNSLDCNNNQLSSLDVTQNTGLTTLYCHTNQLSSLDVTQNTSLTTLYCHTNQLSSLDVAQNTSLTTLYCHTNQLTSLDVSQNTSLINLKCYINQLTSLDVSQNINLQFLYCYTNHLTSLDVTSNTNLQELWSSNNPLGSIDVTQNTSLLKLWCHQNQLSNLDVTQNNLLQLLRCENNQLSSLDLSQHTNLTYLKCFNNQLSSLNVANGNNSSFIGFDATNNPNLFCIEVDDVAYSTANWPDIDPQSSFSTNCAASVDESALNRLITIYPNPVNHILNLSAQDQIKNVSIYNVTGQEVMNRQANATEVQLDMSQLQNGIYFVKAQINGQVRTLKVVKQ